MTQPNLINTYLAILGLSTDLWAWWELVGRSSFIQLFGISFPWAFQQDMTQ